MKDNIICWAIIKNNKLLFYDGMPCIYRSKKRTKEECSIFDEDHQRIAKVKITIKELERL